jgi:hypothetical protein
LYFWKKKGDLILACVLNHSQKVAHPPIHNMHSLVQINIGHYHNFCHCTTVHGGPRTAVTKHWGCMRLGFLHLLYHAPPPHFFLLLTVKEGNRDMDCFHNTFLELQSTIVTASWKFLLHL